MGKKLISSVVLRHPDTAEPFMALMGTEPPEWADLSGSPHLFGEVEAADTPDDSSVATTGTEGGSDADLDSSPFVAAPHRNAGKPEWLAHARRKGYTGADDEITKAQLVKRYS